MDDYICKVEIQLFKQDGTYDANLLSKKNPIAMTNGEFVLAVRQAHWIWL